MAWLAISVLGFHVATEQAARLEHEAEESAFARAEVAAQAIEQTLLRVLEAAESLHELAQGRQSFLEAGNVAGARMIEAQLANVAHRGRFGILQLAVINADGWLGWSSVTNWRPVDLGDREHFRVHRDASPGLFVSAPLVGRASNQWSVQVTRPLHDAAGRFAGVAVVSIDPLGLSQDLGETQLGTNGRALVLRRDGVIIASSSGPQQVLGATLASAEPLMQALATSPSGRLRVAQSLLQGTPKLVGYRVLHDTPLAVTVALDADLEAAPVAFARPAFQATALAMSLLTLLLMALSLLWVAQRRMQAALDRAQAEREDALARLSHTHRMEALGRLAGGVAHDFNNVLQAVLGGARLIARRPEDAEGVRRLAAMVAEAAERGASVTRRLLTFARRAELRADRVEVASLLDGLREVLIHTLGAEIRVVVAALPALPPLLADRGQLETVLVNLAVNARDAMTARGGGTLTLSAAEDSVAPGIPHPAGLKPGPYLRLSVADTGGGMDEATLARAAEPFFTTKPKGEGTGLGLAMAKGFAEQSGGGFLLTSTVGQGTTVSLWLPRLPAGARPAPARPVAEAARDLRGLRVLLVDDEPLVRMTLAQELGARGWQVSEAESGPAALLRLREDATIDLLVTDLAMPGMDGLALIRDARRHRPGLPALLVTGHAGDAQNALLAAASAGGPFALLRKPVSADLLHSSAELLLQAAAAPIPDEAARGLAGLATGRASD